MNQIKSIESTYECIVGLEVHIQLNTNSKAFAREKNQYSTLPNSNIGCVTLALPGTLPYHNGIQLRKAIKLALALGSKINAYSYFDRKNYFYPDLPKGYQLTQDRHPYCKGGLVVLSNGRNIRIHHIHMEEDAGKSIHTQSDKETYLDYNRAGTPLLELVTEPDFRNGDEVQEFINYLRQLVRYINISDAVMQQGSLRCDVNLSIRPQNSDEYSTRTEIKNLNSASHAKKAVELEFMRQVNEVQKGRKIIQQTLDFDFVSEKITPLRDKEDAQDYKYFPDPDLAPFYISNELIDSIRSEIDLLPFDAKNILTDKYKLSEYDANIICEHKFIVLLFIELAEQNKIVHKNIANFLINHYLPFVKTETDELSPYPLPNTIILEFLDLIQTDKISNSTAHQKLLPQLLKNPKSPLQLAEELNLIQQSNADAIEDMVALVLANFPEKVKTYRKGKKGLIGFFMGELMKKSKGKINPKVAKNLLEKSLNQ